MEMDNVAVWLIVMTLCAYAIGCLIHERIPFLWSNPVFISPLLIIPVLLLTHTEYQAYQTATHPITFLLGPAQIAMVIPLYRHARLLSNHIRSILAGVSVGSSAGILFVVGAAYVFHLSQATAASLAPKSITTPMAISVSHLTGGMPELTALFVTLTGLTGIMIGPVILRWTGVKNTMVKGLAMGTAASMIGAASAAQWGEAEGVMGVLGMTLSAVFIAAVAPELLSILL